MQRGGVRVSAEECVGVVEVASGRDMQAGSLLVAAVGPPERMECGVVVVEVSIRTHTRPAEAGGW